MVQLQLYKMYNCIFYVAYPGLSYIAKGISQIIFYTGLLELELREAGENRVTKQWCLKVLSVHTGDFSCDKPFLLLNPAPT